MLHAVRKVRTALTADYLSTVIRSHITTSARARYNSPMPFYIRIGRKDLRKLSRLGLLVLAALLLAALTTSGR